MFLSSIRVLWNGQWRCYCATSLAFYFIFVIYKCVLINKHDINSKRSTYRPCFGLLRGLAIRIVSHTLL